MSSCTFSTLTSTTVVPTIGSCGRMKRRQLLPTDDDEDLPQRNERPPYCRSLTYPTDRRRVLVGSWPPSGSDRPDEHR